MAHADRASYILIGSATEKPPMAAALDYLHVTYTLARFDFYWVITPISRTVQPAGVFGALLYGYWGT